MDAAKIREYLEAERNTNDPESLKRQLREAQATIRVLFAMWAWHEEVKNINADRDPSEVKYISLEHVRKYPPSVDKVMMYLYGVPEKLVYAKLDEMERQDLIEYGGTIRLGWPTEKGLKMLQEAGLI